MMKYGELTSELFNSYILSNALVWSGRLLKQNDFLIRFNVRSIKMPWTKRICPGLLSIIKH